MKSDKFNIICIINVILLLVVVCSSCYQPYSKEEIAVIRKDLDLPIYPYKYESGYRFYNLQLNHIKLPQNISKKETRRIIDNRVTLGRVLFYDSNLSFNSTISCSSCHQIERAFSDTIAFSKTAYGGLTKRNTLALGVSHCIGCDYEALKLPQKFSWSDETHSAYVQINNALVASAEMDSNYDSIISRLREREYYKILMVKAFSGISLIDSVYILEALSSFVNSINVTNSKFDLEYKRSGNILPPFETFTDSENLGKEIFIKDCLACHGNTFGINSITHTNNGLLDSIDLGMGQNKSHSLRNNVFKVPFLRNIVLTGPYMHDGRFATIDDVLDHYSTDILPHPNLSSRLRNSDKTPIRFNDTNQQKSKLIDFLSTLTDTSSLQQKRFNNPFIKLTKN